MSLVIVLVVGAVLSVITAGLLDIASRTVIPWLVKRLFRRVRS